MKFYEMYGKEIYNTYEIESDIGSKISHLLSEDKPVESEWEKKKLSYYPAEREPSFYLSLDGIIVNNSQKKLFSDIFAEGSVEYLPVYYEDMEMEIIHVIKCADVKCKFINKIIEFFYIFDVQELIDYGINDMYYIKAHQDDGWCTPTFYTEKFVNKMKELGVKGIYFKEVWDSEKQYEE